MHGISALPIRMSEPVIVKAMSCLTPFDIIGCRWATYARSGKKHVRGACCVGGRRHASPPRHGAFQTATRPSNFLSPISSPTLAWVSCVDLLTRESFSDSPTFSSVALFLASFLTPHLFSSILLFSGVSEYWNPRQMPSSSMRSTRSYVEASTGPQLFQSGDTTVRFWWCGDRIHARPFAICSWSRLRICRLLANCGRKRFVKLDETCRNGCTP